MGKEYWAKRQRDVQRKIADKTIAQCERELARQYKRSMEKIIDSFEAVYDKVQNTVADGMEPTPADLYKLDKYWQMQAQLKEEAQKLGDKSVELLSKAFEDEWREVYEKTAIQSDRAFSTISTANAKAVVDNVWLADGKSFSTRIWKNTEKLVETLNDELIHCVVTGKKTTELRELLENRFDVSRRQANTLIRTEAAHIQTEAARQRYQDSGIQQVEFWADPDERTCDVCGKLHKQKFPVNAPPMVPAHPNCRCCILPVVD